MSEREANRSKIIVGVGGTIGVVAAILGLLSAGPEDTTVERASEPVASITANTLGSDPQMGPTVLLSLGAAAVVVAFAAAWLLE